jgi:hypothetical protein
VTSQRLRVGRPASICISLREPNPNIFKTAQPRQNLSHDSTLQTILILSGFSLLLCALLHTVSCESTMGGVTRRIQSRICHSIRQAIRFWRSCVTQSCITEDTVTTRAPSQKPPLSTYFSFFPTSSKRHEIISSLSGKLIMTISGATSDMSAQPVVHLSNCAVLVLNFSRLSQCATKRAQCYQKSVLFRWPCQLQPCAQIAQITIQRPNIWAFADMQLRPPSPDVYQ